MLGDITAATDIYIICGYTDMRKSIDGLCAIIRDQLHFEPEHTTALYLFCGRRNDRIKALLHENDGCLIVFRTAEPSRVFPAMICLSSKMKFGAH